MEDGEDETDNNEKKDGWRRSATRGKGRKDVTLSKETPEWRRRREKGGSCIYREPFRIYTESTDSAGPGPASSLLRFTFSSLWTRRLTGNPSKIRFQTRTFAAKRM